MGCFPILLCSWEGCPSLGISSRAEAKAWIWPELSARKGLHSQADPCPPGELLGFVLRVTDGTQELRTVGRDISEAAS